MKNKFKIAFFYLVMVAIVVIPLIGGIYLLKDRLATTFENAYIHYVRFYMSEEEKQKLYKTIAKSSQGLYDAIPEPLVGRILQPYTIKNFKKAEIKVNNAGMRDVRHYSKKQKNTFRIVVLGDSFVEGTAGREEDRFTNQLEEIVRASGALKDKKVEVYSLGIGSWSLLNEVTYLSSRITAYDPDIIIITMVGNDISDTQGVTGLGYVANGFTPEYRHLGSGVFHINIPYQFGSTNNNLVYYDFGPESRKRWEKSFKALKRLESLQEARGGKMLFSASVVDAYFDEIAKYYFAKQKLKSPFIFVNFHPTLIHGETTLEHDGHPNRKGHRFAAIQYLHCLVELGWIEVNKEKLPPLHPNSSIEYIQEPNIEKLTELRQRFAQQSLVDEITFNELDGSLLRSFLGGVYADTQAKQKLLAYPFGTTKTAFLLKKKDDTTRVIVEVETPPFPELYPFNLEMYLHGKLVDKLMLNANVKAGRHKLEGNIPDLSDNEAAIEVLLRTDSYWTTIDNHIMKSYKLISAKQK